jgi:CRP-like cAMP-binding protein
MKSKTTKDHVLHFKTFLQEKFTLPEKESERLNEYFQLESFPKNEYFIREGKVCRKLAFIAEGVMRYCMFRDDGTEVTCFFMCENDFVGDPDSFFSQKPSDKNAQALTDCQLITITYENMQNSIQQLSHGKEINAAIDHYVTMKMLYQRTFLLNLDASVRYKVHERICPYFTEDTIELHCKFPWHYPTIIKQASQTNACDS